MRAVIFLLALIVACAAGEFHQAYTDADEEIARVHQEKIKSKEFVSVMNQRSYAYISAAIIILLFAAVVWCHVKSVQKSRLLEQYQQQGGGALPEWSPLLHDRKNIRPPPPYSQVV